MEKISTATAISGNHRTIITPCKGSENYQTCKVEGKNQLEKIQNTCSDDLYNDGKTRMQIALDTGIERASVCRRVATLFKQGKIWSCGRHLCPITLCRAEFLTTNPNICLNYFARKCKRFYKDLDSAGQVEILRLIKLYCVERTAPEVSVILPDVRELWMYEVKPLIDRELGL